MHSDIRQGIGIYQASIDAADAEMGADIWLTTDEATFINPRSHEVGWKSIAANFYGEIMGNTFSKRSLQIIGEPVIREYGDAAIAEFYWKFDATMRETGAPLHTEGRESQVWSKMPGSGWRLIQVHYSGMPVTGEGEGF